MHESHYSMKMTSYTADDFTHTERRLQHLKVKLEISYTISNYAQLCIKLIIGHLTYSNLKH